MLLTESGSKFMARTDRLFRLLDTMRRLPAPVTAARLAAEIDVSLRTLYRDIDALRASGARIEGAAGVGYTLTEDPALPPQQLDRLEIEALTLGFAAIRDYADRELTEAGERALAKITARLSEDGQRAAMHAVLRSYPLTRQAPPNVDVALLRRACWEECEAEITYTDAMGRGTRRKVWPLAILYMDNSLLLLAHCLMRQDSRAFRLDRIQSLNMTGKSFRPRRAGLLKHYSDLRARGWARDN